MWYKSITDQASKLTSRQRGVCPIRVGGEHYPRSMIFIDLGLWTPSGPLLMEPDDLLDTLAYSVHH